jgi:hypothetical protein
LQKCIKTKDFNYLQNEHLCKTRGEGVPARFHFPSRRDARNAFS